MSSKNIFFIFLIFLLIISGISYFHYNYLEESLEQKSIDLAEEPQDVSQLKEEFKKELDKMGINIDGIREINDSEGKGKAWTLEIPKDILLIRCNHALTKITNSANWEVLSCFEADKGKELVFRVGKNDSLHLKIIFKNSENAVRIVGKIALVIDNFGTLSGKKDNKKVAEKFIKSKIPFTLALFPGEEFSREIAIEGIKKNKDVIISLPFEETGKITQIQVRDEMNEEELLQQLTFAIRGLPIAKGLCNFKGEKFASDKDKIEVLTKFLIENELYFVDGFVTDKACKIMKKEDVKIVRKDVFLGGNANEIEKQFDFLIALTRQKGKTIGFAHASQTTFDAISSRVSKLAKEGIRIVKVTEFLE
ncbi:divergent polysaccharide deacetylase family protein [bacterium]|nr:divergent polysaccharide deacetylase family protein [bacterium]